LLGLRASHGHDESVLKPRSFALPFLSRGVIIQISGTPKARMGRKKALQQSPKKATVKKSTVSQARRGTSRPVKPARESQPQRTTRQSGTFFSPSFPVVGIGASAGGLEAFTYPFEPLPIHTRMAFLLVPHPDPTHQRLR